ncbi:hypothetical protein JCM11251_004887 [Rhodosporidiobolus azoricus]
MSDSPPPPASGTTPPSSSSSRQPPAPATSHDLAESAQSAQTDPVASFKFAKAPAPAIIGAKGGAAGGGGVGGAMLNISGGGANGERKDSEASWETDNLDDIVLASRTRSAAAPSSSHARQPGTVSGSGQVKPFAFGGIPPIPPFNREDFRLPASAQGSPPRAPFQTSGRSSFKDGGGGGVGRVNYTPFSSMASSRRSQATQLGDRRASTGTSNSSGLKKVGLHTIRDQHGTLTRISASLNSTPSSPVPSASDVAILPAATSKKRLRTSAEPLLAPPLAETARLPQTMSASGARVKSVGGSSGLVNAVETAIGGVREASMNGGTGVEQLPAAKRRKQDATVIGFEGVLGQVSKWQSESQAKNDEIRRLQAQLADKTTEIDRLIADKTKLKTEMTAQVKSALQRAHEAIDISRTTASDASKDLEKLKGEIGSEADANGIKEELDKVKSEFSNVFLNESLELWLERHEETKVAVLKELQAELINRQGVIDLLRDKLDSRTGELAESRDLLIDVKSRIAELELTKTSLSAELDAIRRTIGEEKLAMADKLEAALVAGMEREKTYQERLEQAHEKGEKVRRHMSERCEEVEGNLAHAKREASDMEERHKEELQSMKETLQSKEAECAALSQRIDTVTNELHETKRAFAALDAALQRKDADLVEAQETAAQVREILRAHEQRKVALTEQLNELRLARESHKRDLAAVTSCGEADKQEIERLQARLATAQERLANPSIDSAQVEELSRLRAANVELNATNASLSADKESIVAEKHLLEQSLHAAVEKETRTQEELFELSSRASRLEKDLGAAQHQLSQQDEKSQALERELAAARSAQPDIDTKLKEAAAKAEEEKKKAVRAAIASTREGAARDLASKSNELKRLSNRYEDTNKKLQKVSNELAKAKGAAVLNQHIGSSSGSDPVKPLLKGAAKPPLLPDSQAQGVLPDPSSDLTAVESEAGSPPNENQPKSMVKVVKFAAPDGIVDNPKRSGTSPAKPFVKKFDGKAKRLKSSKKVDVGESEETDDEDEDEDDIVDSLTPLPGAQKGRSRSTTKATYSAKKRR